MKKYLSAILVFTVLLFLWSGFTQMLPWGIPTAQKITVQSDSIADEIPGLIKLQANILTTADFDATFNHKISTYTTDSTFSWIVTQPFQASYSGYFIGEIITQFFVGLLLTALLVLTTNHQTSTRILLICIVGLVAWAVTYGQMINWWGMPLSYAVGIGVNLIIGWSLAALLVSRFIIKSKIRHSQSEQIL